MAESGYNTDPLVWLLGHANVAKVVVEGIEMKAMVYTGSQISAPTKGFCTEMGMKILPLRNLIGGVLHLKGIRGILITYKGCAEASLIIAGLP